MFRNFRSSISIQLVSLILGFSLSTQAKLNTYSISSKTISIDAKEHWQVIENLSSSPLVLLGPSDGIKRIVITVSPTTIKDFKFDPLKIKESVSDYQDGRKQWLKKAKGELIKFFPYTQQKWNEIKEIHTIGYQYKVLGTSFIERTYFFNCGNEVFNINTLLTDKHYKKNKNEVEDLLRSIKCN